MTPEVQTIQSVFSQIEASEIVSVIGPVADYLDRLSAVEMTSVERAVAKRQREFSTGRAFARVVMSTLGVAAAPVPMADNRAPQWPAAMLGSISHSDQIAWVVGARRSSNLQGLGADIEKLGRLQPELNEKLFVAAELARLQQLAADSASGLLDNLAMTEQAARRQQLATLWFSAKEAVYKATAPIAGAFIGFQEVELIPSNDGSQFTMRYLGDHTASAVMEQGRGHLVIRDDHAMALFTIAAS